MRRITPPVMTRYKPIITPLVPRTAWRTLKELRKRSCDGSKRRCGTIRWLRAFETPEELLLP
jgi:hypothetical protein